MAVDGTTAGSGFAASCSVGSGIEDADTDGGLLSPRPPPSLSLVKGDAANASGKAGGSIAGSGPTRLLPRVSVLPVPAMRSVVVVVVMMVDGSGPPLPPPTTTTPRVPS